MGTRHLIAVKLDGEYKIAQYGQWDGYPSGQGATVLEFLASFDRKVFEEKLRASRFLSDEEIKSINAIIKAENIQDSWQKRWPEISRDTGADILHLVEKSDAGIKLKNGIDFANDSLFCEWAYIIDFDNNVLEVFRGFNQSPMDEDERFYKAAPDKDGYYPIKKAASYKLNSLPTVEQMELDCRTKEEIEEEMENY